MTLSTSVLAQHHIGRDDPALKLTSQRPGHISLELTTRGDDCSSTLVLHHNAATDVAAREALAAWLEGLADVVRGSVAAPPAPPALVVTPRNPELVP